MRIYVPLLGFAMYWIFASLFLLAYGEYVWFILSIVGLIVAVSIIGLISVLVELYVPIMHIINSTDRYTRNAIALESAMLLMIDTEMMKNDLRGSRVI